MAPYVLIIMMTFQNGDAIAMHDFNSKETCEQAIQDMPVNWKKYIPSAMMAYCVKK